MEQLHRDAATYVSRADRRTDSRRCARGLVYTVHCWGKRVQQLKQEAQLMLTTGSTRLAVSRGQQTWYHSTCYIYFPIVQ